MSRERPILFSGEMVRAILEDRKWQTRRVMSPQPIWHGEWGTTGYEWKDKAFTDSEFRKMIVRFCPYGKPGDRLWVRETWHNDSGNEFMPTYYPASMSEYEYELAGIRHVKKRPSIFMPRWASRITLEITGVRVERLQEISEEDAEAEGCEKTEIDQEFINEVPPGTKERELALVMRGGHLTAKFHYQILWDEMNGKKYPWKSNPWVWVIEFKRLAPPDAPGREGE